MSRLVLPVALVVFIGLVAPAFAQMTITPGPGGVPIAPGSPVPGYTPGGVGPGGTEIGPGPATRGVPMYRIGPGDVPLAPRPDPYADESRTGVGLYRGCGKGGACPPGESLPQYGRLTVGSRHAGTGESPSAEKPINSMRELRTALRTCWHPPEQLKRGSQMTVRASFKRTGNVIAPPVVTYATRGMSADTKRDYLNSIRAAFDHCAPLPFSKSFSGAITGVPISIRFVDNRASGARQR